MCGCGRCLTSLPLLGLAAAASKGATSNSSTLPSLPPAASVAPSGEKATLQKASEGACGGQGRAAAQVARPATAWGTAGVARHKHGYRGACISAFVHGCARVRVQGCRRLGRPGRLRMLLYWLWGDAGTERRLCMASIVKTLPPKA